MFGGDAGSAGCACGGGTPGAVSFGIARDHAADFSAGAEADYAADGGRSRKRRQKNTLH